MKCFWPHSGQNGLFLSNRGSVSSVETKVLHLWNFVPSVLTPPSENNGLEEVKKIIRKVGSHWFLQRASMILVTSFKFHYKSNIQQYSVAAWNFTVLQFHTNGFKKSMKKTVDMSACAFLKSNFKILKYCAACSTCRDSPLPASWVFAIKLWAVSPSEWIYKWNYKTD